MENTLIENAKYVYFPETVERGGINATIDGIQMSVPLDPANRHYAAIMAAVEAGTLTIAEASAE